MITVRTEPLLTVLGKKESRLPMVVVPAHHYRQTYSEADLEALFREYAITPGLQPEVAKALEDSAAIWRWHGGEVGDHTPPGASIKSLRSVAKAAEGLKSALEALPAPARRALDMQFAQADLAVITEQVGVAGLPILHGLADDGTMTPIIPDLNEIAHLIEALRHMAIDAESFPLGASRSKRNHALRMWVINIEALWTQSMGRPFTRDMTAEGEPISEAARFCVAAFGRLSPGTPKHTILNAMKSCIKSVKAKSLANDPSKNAH